MNYFAIFYHDKDAISIAHRDRFIHGSYRNVHIPPTATAAHERQAFPVLGRWEMLNISLNGSESCL